MESLVQKKDYHWQKLMVIILLTGLGFLCFPASNVLAEQARDAPLTSTAPINQPVQPNSQVQPGQPLTFGQIQNAIDKITLQVWPEYDDPRVLVMVAGEFRDKVNYPRKFLFQAPKEADINSTCSLTADGTHLSQLYSVNKLEDSREISFNMPEPRFHYEYYYNPFNPLSESGQKTFDLSFKLPYPVDKLEVEIQQPLKATNFSLTPVSQTSGPDQGGFNAYRYVYNKLEAGQIVPFKVSYTKTDSAPSVKKTSNQSQMGSSSQPGNKSMIVILTIGAAAAMALGGYWIISGKRTVAQPAMVTTRRNAGAKHPERGGNGKGMGTVASGTKFCSSCGSRLSLKGKFCANCGAKVKS
ncbi:MAG: zinc ribbon domain-containing protein [Candidatus Tectomicrobia bacterium]|uniref:Zinc ribbon domain-containing protein n=1 Tax=Tectimicrobiota bacterium TaxID=2528274 RepID=A0A933GJS2_UNCTE|nr:zinc ribbon domain-containing protein [Candidatus Tectomicrobia bacterium]